jgi:2-polyprenyl-3-methyl-5-hydroxy-6-metoxy-1,4-benzoquinol methylase
MKRPDYVKHLAVFFDMPLKTKAEVQRIGIERKARLLQEWQANEDFSVYDDEDYLWDALQCYEKVTTPAIQGIVKYDGLGNGRTLIDVWNGCSLSSIQAAQAGFNVFVMNTSARQLELGRFLQQRMLGYELPVVELDTTMKFDVVCSFEALEHYKEPLPHLDELIRLTKDDGMLAIGTGFNDENNVGHYKKHLVNGALVSNRQVPRLLDKHLKGQGFEKVFSYFNGRPRIWKKLK